MLIQNSKIVFCNDFVLSTYIKVSIFKITLIVIRVISINSLRIKKITESIHIIHC